ncbi:MAG: (2Fe-2S)-binding protein [Bacteriovoracaceae bacterium]|nr:(2Fe-2S)-binding protein [Bacteriovoracaceae bacterium]
MSNSSFEITMPKVDLNYTSAKTPVHSDPNPEAKPLPKVTIDGKAYEFKPGDTIMQVAERYNLHEDIPRYCYHPGMPIAGTCRMCTVEVEKAPKLMTSCSTPAGDGMVVHTRSEKVLKSRNGVMDFLLANHPLDCPVCDKAGECELQDYTFEYGPQESNFKEEKRVFKEATTKKLSDKVTLNMNRCVHCERCVRFTDDVTKTNDLVMLNRGWHKELAATDEKVGLTNDYQGCLTDFCPVGALTFNDFRFEKRVWFLDKKPSLCDGCSKGCNIEVHHDKEIVQRYMPIYNEKVNGHWMCDEGRLSYHTYADADRIVSPLVHDQASGRLASTNWETASQVVNAKVKSATKTLVVLGTDATTEEGMLVKGAFANRAEVKYHSGFGDNKALDHLLRQSDKTPNTNGLKAIGLSPLAPTDINGNDLVIVIRQGRARLPKVEGQDVILVGVYSREEIETLKTSNVRVHAVLPSLATIEKDGSFTNCDGHTQSFTAAVTHRGKSLAMPRILAALVGEKR